MDANQTKVLRIVRDRHPISRADIADMTGLDRSTITRVTRSLMDEGFLVEAGTTVSNQPGRRRVGLELNHTARFAVGIQFGDTRAMIVLVDLTGKVHRLATLEITSDSALADVVRDVAELVVQVIEEERIGRDRLLGCGIGVAGLVNAGTGEVYLAPNLQGRYVPVLQSLEAKLGCPVYIDNEVNTMALGELWFGAGKGHHSLLCISVGRGIGSGVVIDGTVYRGHTGIAGEIGHLIVDINGPVCGCGNHGCLETLAGGRALIKAVSEIRDVGEGPHHRNVVSALAKINDYLKAGDAEVSALADRVAQYLGVGVANALHAFNPEQCIIGGPLAIWCPTVIDRAVVHARRYLLEGARNTVITKSKLCDQAESLGAAALVLEQFFGPAGSW